MIDSLYLKSLFSTLIIYLAIVGLLVAFVTLSGIAGFLLIVAIIVLLVVYFYGALSRKDSREKGFRS